MKEADNILNSQAQQTYWAARYESNKTGWNIGYASTPIKEYFDTIEDKHLKILIPGAGNAYEAEYLFQQGFRQIHVLDISYLPLEAFQSRVSSFPSEQLLHENFFEHQGQYDLIVEQTFFCSFPPSKENRTAYAQKMYELLKVGGTLVGLWFKFPINANDGERPYGGSLEEYLTYFEPLFEIESFEEAHNSIPPRLGKELFGVMKKNS